MKKNLISEGELLINLLAYSSRLGVFAENENLLKDPLEGIMQHKEVTLVQVFTDDGRQLKKQERIKKGTHEKSIKKDFTRHERIMDMIRKSKSPYYSEGNDEIEFWAPVISKRSDSEEEVLFFEENPSQTDYNIIGFVKIIFTTKVLNKNLKDTLFKSILIPIFFMIPGWFIVYLIVKGITSPLNRLTEGVTAVGTGGSAERVSVETKDEIGKLAQAFNNMVESLKTKDTEKQQIEEQLRQAQKMEAIGTLAGGIAHDFNNILSVIIGYGNLLRKKINSQDSEREYLDNLLSTAKRASSLTKSLLTFSRQQEINLKPVNINDIIRDLEKMLVRLLSKDIEFKVKLSKEDLVVMSDTGQIEQVLINLVTNAGDAMPNGGFLTITTESINMDKQFIIFSGYGYPGQYAMISVTDTGIGMNDQIKEKIFDPFFTTKEVGKGTGLGLSMVYGITKQHKGYINVSSELGQGTTFKIYLQLSKLEIKEDASEILPTSMAGNETILIAEDDANVRRLTTYILKQYGYKVIEAVDGNDAIMKFIENKDRVNFLLLDVIIPKKSGIEVFQEIKKINTDIKALFISGHSDNIIHEEGKLADETHFLPKPVLPDELIKKIREILDK